MSRLLGVDLAWGDDLVCGGSGDLNLVDGEACVAADMAFGVLSNGLAWDSGFGAHCRAAVDGSPLAMGALRGRILATVLADDRVVSATVTPRIDTEVTGDVYFDIDVVLISGVTISEHISAQ